MRSPSKHWRNSPWGHFPPGPASTSLSFPQEPPRKKTNEVSVCKTGLHDCLSESLGTSLAIGPLRTGLGQEVALANACVWTIQLVEPLGSPFQGGNLELCKNWTLSLHTGKSYSDLLSPHSSLLLALSRKPNSASSSPEAGHTVPCTSQRKLKLRDALVPESCSGKHHQACDGEVWTAGAISLVS